MEPMKGKWDSSRVDLGYTELFCILEMTSVFFSSCEIVLGDSVVFHHANQGSLRVSFGTRDCSACNAGELRLISQRGGCLMGFLELRQESGYTLELQRGWSFETPLCSAKSGLLSSYDGHLRTLNSAWQDNSDASRGEAGDQASLSSCHSDIGIPIHFQQESGIITI